MFASLSAFGDVAVFVKEKFRDGIRIFVKVEICCFLSKLQIPHPTSVVEWVCITTRKKVFIDSFSPSR